jgi:hypothetical protein
VFSTRKTDLELESGYDDAVLAPLDVAGFQDAPTVEAGGGGGRLSYGAETWTLAYARSDWTAPIEGGLGLRQDGGRWFVRNDLGFDLDAVGLSIPDTDGDEVIGFARLGALAAGAEVEIPAAPEVRSIGSARPDDPFEWAVQTFGPNLPPSRGAAGAEDTLRFVATAARPIEPIALSGLSPVERPLALIRMSLPEMPVTVDLTKNAVILALDPSLDTVWANLACGDDERSAGATTEELRFDDVPADGCELQLYAGSLSWTGPVRPGTRGSCTVRNDALLCTMGDP